MRSGMRNQIIAVTKGFVGGRILGFGLLVVVAGMLASASAQGSTTVTIYSDQFGRSGNLGGTSPSPVDTGAATWAATTTGSPNITTDGTQAIQPGFNENAFLPFVPQSGIVYTLTVDMKANNNNSNWMSLGFANGTSDGSFLTADSVVGWLLERGNATGDQAFTGPGAGGSSLTNTNILTAGIFHHYEIVLDTRPTLWQVTFYSSDADHPTLTAFGPTLTFATNPTITEVGFGATSQTGDVKNFTLVEEVPEPASLSLLAGGMVLMLRRRK